MTTLAHISDLHFGRSKADVLAGLLKSLITEQPELIIISGDLTQRAKMGEYHAAAAFIKQLPCPYLAVPGNHDLAAFNLLERFCFSWEKWCRLICEELHPVIEEQEYIVAGINTARRWGALFDWTRGRISDSQAAAVHEKMKSRPGRQLRLLAAHHPFWLPSEQRHRQLIGGRDAALEILNDGELDLILSGHIHLAYTQVLEGIIISHAGTSASDRLLPNQPNSYNLISGDRNALIIDTLAWNGESFTRQNVAGFHRSSNGWSQTDPI